MAVLSFEPEQRQALLFSVGLHLGIVLLLMVSTQQVSITPPKGITIEAEIMDLESFMNNNQPAEKPVEQPKPPEPKQEPIPVQPEPIEEPVEKPIEKPVEKPIEKPAEKPVIKPTVDPIKRAEKTERQKKLEELRRKRQAAEQQAQKPPTNETTKEPEATAVTQPPVGVTNGAEDQRRTLQTQYIGAIQAAVTRQWARPNGTKAGLQCVIKVNQIPGGGVIDVSIGSPCNASAVVRNSIINAVKKADPLPYTGFEDVFDRRLNFNFQYQGD